MLRQMWTFLRKHLRPCLVLWIKFKLCQLLGVKPIKAVSLLLAVAVWPGGWAVGRGPWAVGRWAAMVSRYIPPYNIYMFSSYHA